jgi:hypothetical protein
LKTVDRVAERGELGQLGANPGNPGDLSNSGNLGNPDQLFRQVPSLTRRFLPLLTAGRTASETPRFGAQIQKV